jgi:hypothetical protein
MSEPDEGYSRNVPDEGYSRNVPDEGYSRNVPDEGFSRNASYALNLISTFKIKKKHNRICVGQHYRQTNRNNVNKIKVLRTTFWSACKLESD